jgi:hypothetical protein
VAKSSHSGHPGLWRINQLIRSLGGETPYRKRVWSWILNKKNVLDKKTAIRLRSQGPLFRGSRCKKIIDTRIKRAVCPEWANFRPLDDCFLWTVSCKVQKLLAFLGHSFPQLRLYINFGREWIGLHFGRIFHKLIWSPWRGWKGREGPAVADQDG